MSSTSPDTQRDFSGKVERALTGPAGMIGAYVICIYCVEPEVFRLSNLSSVVYYTCLLVPALLGALLLVVLGQFDLSVGAVAALSGVVLAVCVKVGLPLPLGLAASLGAGGLFGGVNWLLVNRGNIPALIATLITMFASRACSIGLSQGDVIGGLPTRLGALTLTSGFISPAVLLGVALVILLTLLARHHYIVLRLFQAGSSREAALNAGIQVAALEALAFIATGVGAAMVGVLQASRTLSASPNNFPDLALECIAACVIGGARASGGYGSPVGAFAGMLLVVLSRNLVNLAGISVYWRDLGIAAVLLASALINRPSKTS